MTENQLVDSRDLIMIQFLTYGVYERPPAPPAAKLGLGLRLSWPYWWPVGLLVEQHCRRTSGLFKYTLNIPVLLPTVNRKTLSVNNIKRQIFRIGTVHYAEGL